MPAIVIAPSQFPLRFSEVANFRGTELDPTELVNPKGVAFHPALNQVLVTLTATTKATGGVVIFTNAVRPDGTLALFAPNYHPSLAVEAMLAVVASSGPPVSMGHFNPGDVFVNRGPGGQISRLSAAGAVLADVWTDLNSNGLWGGITFDTTGMFGGRLVAIDNDGKIFLVDATGHSTLLANLAHRTEGVAVAPASFGPLGGQIIVGVEGYDDNDPQSGKVYAVNANGVDTLLADIGYTAEHIQFIPANGGTYYQAELSFERARENRLWSASSSQFLSRVGHMLVINEMSGDLWEVAWDGAQYTQSLAGRVPGRWSSQGLGVQRTELEGGDFAQRAPVLPGWTNWSPVPGGGTTDAQPNAAVDYSNNLHLFVKGINDRRVYMQSMSGNNETWGSWMEVAPGGLTTHHSLASALHENQLHLFCVRDDGHIMQKRVFIVANPSAEAWTEVPGGMVTDAAVTAAVATGRLVLCAKRTDNQLFINELAVGGRTWSGWSPVPGGGQTNVNPMLIDFDDELYLLIKGLTSNRILMKARSPEGAVWTPWAELPGVGHTDAAITAVSANDQCYVFLKGIDDRAPYFNVASSSGTWSGWKGPPNPGTTDVPFGIAAIGARVYLFAKGIDDKRIYMRRTT